MKGWVSFHRQIMEWEWYTDSNTFRLFFHLVLNANHDDGLWKGNNIKRGQLITSGDKLASQLELSRQQIRTSLKKLELTHEITTKSTSRFTLITVAKYDFYQASNKESTSEAPTEQPANNQQITTNNNVNNENKENKETISELDTQKRDSNKQYKNNLYVSIFDYYISLELIKHKSLTGDMKKAIDKAKKELSLDEDHMKRMLKRHKRRLKENPKFKKRGLAEFFGQKKYQSVSLICSDYSDDYYPNETKNTSRDLKKPFVPTFVNYNIDTGEVG